MGWAETNKLNYKKGEGEKTVMGAYKKFYSHMDETNFNQFYSFNSKPDNRQNMSNYFESLQIK